MRNKYLLTSILLVLIQLSLWGQTNLVDTIIDISGPAYTGTQISKDGTYRFTGTFKGKLTLQDIPTDSCVILVDKGISATIILDNVTITEFNPWSNADISQYPDFVKKTNYSSISAYGAKKVNILLKGKNTLKFWGQSPGICAPHDGDLIIDTFSEDGSLYVYGESDDLDHKGFAAAIGSCNTTYTGEEYKGTITVKNGNITARGGNFGPAIGTGHGISGGTVNIAGGTVIAYGGSSASAWDREEQSLIIKEQPSILREET